MRTLTRITALVALALLLGCPIRSEQLVERGVVVQSNYSPGGSGSTVGMSTGGHLVFGSTTINPSYTVVFHCEHGVSFAVEDRATWETVQPGDSVNIYFYEIYPGKEDHTVLDYQFISAVPIHQRGTL